VDASNGQRIEPQRMDDQKTNRAGGGSMTSDYTLSRREQRLISAYVWLLRAIAAAAFVMGICRLLMIGDAGSWWLIGGGICLLCLPAIEALKDRSRTWIISKITELIAGNK
jgi:hypothetical protein